MSRGAVQSFAAPRRSRASRAAPRASARTSRAYRQVRAGFGRDRPSFGRPGDHDNRELDTRLVSLDASRSAGAGDRGGGRLRPVGRPLPRGSCGPLRGPRELSGRGNRSAAPVGLYLRDTPDTHLSVEAWGHSRDGRGRASDSGRVSASDGGSIFDGADTQSFEVASVAAGYPRLYVAANNRQSSAPAVSSAEIATGRVLVVHIRRSASSLDRARRVRLRASRCRRSNCFHG